MLAAGQSFKPEQRKAGADHYTERVENMRLGML
jgi:hypothetical protein